MASWLRTEGNEEVREVSLGNWGIYKRRQLEDFQAFFFQQGSSGSCLKLAGDERGMLVLYTTYFYTQLSRELSLLGMGGVWLLLVLSS